MELQNISNTELINRMQNLVRTERKITHLILTHILEIELRRLYADLGFDGMYTYLTRGLGYSEAAAYRRLQSARLLKQVPEIAEKIESGAIHLSQLTKVQKCLNESAEKGVMISSVNTLEVLEKLENKNTFETEAVLAKEFDRPIKTQDILKPQSDDSVRLEITLTAQQFADLEKAKDLLSHICHQGTWSEVIATLAERYCKRSQPESERKNPKGALTSDAITSTQGVIATKLSGRKTIPIKLKRRLLVKANHCCEFKNHKTGKVCQSKYQLEIDHIQPVAFGGGSEPENFRVLCRTHNSMMARRAGLQV